MLIVVYDVIADLISKKKPNPIVRELFIKKIKLNISLVFITQSYFKVPKDVKLNPTHYFIKKILNKRELQKMVINHSSDNDFKEFKKIYRKNATKRYSFLVNVTTLPSDNSLHFRKILLGKILKVIIAINKKITNKKAQDDINLFVPIATCVS